LDCFIELPVNILCIKFSKNPTFKTQVHAGELWKLSIEFSQLH